MEERPIAGRSAVRSGHVPDTCPGTARGEVYDAAALRQSAGRRRGEVRS